MGARVLAWPKHCGEWQSATIPKTAPVGKQFNVNGVTYRVVAIIEHRQDYNVARLERVEA